VIKEKVHEGGTKTAKIPSMIDYTTCNDIILWISLWYIECQCNINDSWFCIMHNLGGDWLWAFLNEVLPGCIPKSESDMLPAPFPNRATRERE
jgi:hypothetical protein